MDLISRQAAIDVLAAMQGRCTSKAALIQNSKIWQQIKDLPSVQPVDKDINVSCKDAISRQGAIDICNNVIDLWQGQLGEGALVAIKNAINNLPSVQPERKAGKWICSDDMYETAVCSVCKWDTTEPWGHIKLWFKFCPRCGAKMEEGGQE